MPRQVLQAVAAVFRSMTFCAVRVNLAAPVSTHERTREHFSCRFQEALSLAAPGPADRAGAGLRRARGLCHSRVAQSEALHRRDDACDLDDGKPSHSARLSMPSDLCNPSVSLELGALFAGADRVWVCMRRRCPSGSSSNNSVISPWSSF